MPIDNSNRNTAFNSSFVTTASKDSNTESNESNQSQFPTGKWICDWFSRHEQLRERPFYWVSPVQFVYSQLRRWPNRTHIPGTCASKDLIMHWDNAEIFWWIALLLQCTSQTLSLCRGPSHLQFYKLKKKVTRRLGIRLQLKSIQSKLKIWSYLTQFNLLHVQCLVWVVIIAQLVTVFVISDIVFTVNHLSEWYWQLWSHVDITSAPCQQLVRGNINVLNDEFH